MPAKGWSNSRIRKIAPETERAQMTSDANVVALAGDIREASKQDNHPKQQHCEKGSGYGATEVRKENEARLHEIVGDLDDSNLQPALHVVGWF